MLLRECLTLVHIHYQNDHEPIKYTAFNLVYQRKVLKVFIAHADPYSSVADMCASDYGMHGSEGTVEILCKNEKLLENTHNYDEPWPTNMEK